MLPASWHLVADRATRRRDDGRLVLGGTPFRVWRLDDRAAAVAGGLLAGDPVGEDPARRALARRLVDAALAHPVPGAASRAAVDVAMVIPFLGSPSALAEALTALDRWGSGPVLVVDDGSPDPAGVAATARAHGARVVHHTRTRGPGAARNTGWRAVDTDVVAFLDHDCRPEPGWLDLLLAHLDDPDVAAVAPRISAEVPRSGLPAVLAAYESARPSLDRGSEPGPVRPRGRVPFVPSAALVVRRADLLAADGFDETLRWGEDVDLVWRLVGSGRTVRYEPAAEVRHRPRGTARAWVRQRFDYGSSAAPLAHRHDEAVRPLGTSRRVAAAVALGALGGPIPIAAATTVAVATTVQLDRRLRALPDHRREAVRLSLLGHGYGAVALADALRRPWWPLLAAASIPSRRARRLAAAVVVVPPLVAWVRERPPLDPVRWTVLRLLDDVAYGAGVWAGCRRERSLRSLRPVLIREARDG